MSAAAEEEEEEEEEEEVDNLHTLTLYRYDVHVHVLPVYLFHSWYLVVGGELLHDVGGAESESGVTQEGVLVLGLHVANLVRIVLQ